MVALVPMTSNSCTSMAGAVPVEENTARRASLEIESAELTRRRASGHGGRRDVWRSQSSSSPLSSSSPPGLVGVGDGVELLGVDVGVAIGSDGVGLMALGPAGATGFPVASGAGDTVTAAVAVELGKGEAVRMPVGTRTSLASLASPTDWFEDVASTVELIAIAPTAVATTPTTESTVMSCDFTHPPRGTLRMPWSSLWA
jgi:hypothetical protein